METTYNVHITPQAQQQLKEISDYISTELKSKETALRLLSIFETAISSLSMFPKRISFNMGKGSGSNLSVTVMLFMMWWTAINPC